MCAHDLMEVSLDDLEVCCRERRWIEACFLDEDDSCVCSKQRYR